MGTPNDALSQSLVSVLEDAIDSALIDVHVALPAKVQVYHTALGVAARTVDVVLQLKRTLPKTDGKYVTEEMPVLANIPVEFPSGGGFSLTFPLKEGDTGLVVFSEQSLDQWRALNAVSSPGDVGRHTLTGGVFRPGLMATAAALATLTDPDNMVFGSDLPAPVGAQVVVKPGPPATLHLGSKDASDALLLGDTFLNDGIVPLISAGYEDHTHSSAFGPTGTPVLGAPLTSLSLRVFGEL